MNLTNKYKGKSVFNKTISIVLVFLFSIQAFSPIGVYAEEVSASLPTEDQVVSIEVSPISESEVPVVEEISSEEAKSSSEETVIESEAFYFNFNSSYFNYSCPTGKECKIFYRNDGYTLVPNGNTAAGFRAVSGTATQICKEQGYEDFVYGAWEKNYWRSPGDNYQTDFVSGGWKTYGAYGGDKEWWKKITCQRPIPVTDVCQNIDGTQATIPDGYFIDTEGKCVPNVPVDVSPIGFLDSASCDVFNGWTFDVDTPTESNIVHFYADGPAGTGVFLGAMNVDMPRPDINLAYEILGNHGFSFPTPASLKDGKSHDIYAYGINTNPANPHSHNSVLMKAWDNLIDHRTISGCVIPGTNTNAAPINLVVDGPKVGVINTSYLFSTVATDPEGQAVTYGFNWDNDGTVDVWSVATASGVAYAHSNSWSNIGTKTFSVVAKDTQGLTSLPVVFSILISEPVTPVDKDIKPIGFLDSASCDVFNGWTFDVDTPTESNIVHFYADGPAGTGVFLGAMNVDMPRPDINLAYEILGNHGFSFPTPASLKDGKSHDIYAYGINTNPANPHSHNSVLMKAWDNLIDHRTISGCVIPNTTPAPVISITATPDKVVSGGSVSVVWSVTNATTCTASGLWSGNKAVSGTESVLVNQAGTLTLSCTGAGGTTSGGANVTIKTGGGDGANNPSVSISANPTRVSTGGNSTISWSSTNTNSCIASGAWSGEKVVSGSENTGILSNTSTYVIACSNTSGTTATSSVTVTVDNGGGTNHAPVFNSFSANPSNINSGSTSTLSWNVSNANTCLASGAWSGSKSVTGNEIVGPLSSISQFTLACTGAGGTATSSVSVSINTNNGSNTPVITIGANPSTISAGSATTINWSTTNANSCTASDAWTGNQSTSGTFTTNPSNTSTYTLVCTGQGGTATSSVTVTVNQVQVPPTTTPENPPTVRSGSGGRGGGPCVGNCTTSTTVPAGSVLINVGQVLGASTSAVCSAGDYISAYMRRSMNNNSVEVMKLQYFLKNNESLDVDTTGIFDDKTEKAVNAFQTKYSSEVLVPWGINYPTGYVYITTKNKINSIVCNSPMSYTGVVEYKNNVLENVSYEEPVDIVGSVGLISATSTSGEPNPSPNIASVFGAFTDLVEKFLKDISWYPLLILILIILGTVLISRSIIIKDKKPIKAREAMINGSTAIAVGSVLNVLNTVSFILNPQWFISRTNFGMNWLLFLDIVNISAVVFIALMVPGYFYFRGTKKR